MTRAHQKALADALARSLDDQGGGAARRTRSSVPQVARMPCRRLRGSLSEAGQGDTAAVVNPSDRCANCGKSFVWCQNCDAPIPAALYANRNDRKRYPEGSRAWACLVLTGTIKYGASSRRRLSSSL